MERQAALTSSFLVFSAADLGVAVFSSKLLLVVGITSCEVVAGIVGTGARLCAAPQPARGRAPCRIIWTEGWLTSA